MAVESPNEAGAPLANDCVLPPILPLSMLPNLTVERDRQAEAHIREYVEWQAEDELVEHAERVTTEFVLGRRLDAWDVHTDKERYWVITSPTNLYSQEFFPSVDYALSLHVGLTARVMSKPDPGVPDLEKTLLASSWRRWEQTAELLDEAEEAEDFQAIGMRCRECLVAMVKEVATPDLLQADTLAPKRSDVVAWCELIANDVAHGESAQHVRGYLKAISKSGWQLVNWLIHASGATRADAILAVEATQHILGTFGTALFRRDRGIPDRCRSCGSYKIELWTPNHGEIEVVARCQTCGATQE